MFVRTWAGKRPAPKTSESTSIIRSAKLKRVHHNHKRSQLAKHRSSVSKNFRKRCAKFYTWLRTAILRRKRFGLRPCICSITLAIAPQATNHRSDSAARAKQRHGLMPRASQICGDAICPVRASGRRGRGRARRRSRDARNGPARAREYGPALVLQAAPPLGSTQQPVYRRACAGRTSHRKSCESKAAIRKSKAASAYDYQARPDGL
jgi:hypothetical protein